MVNDFISVFAPVAKEGEYAHQSFVQVNIKVVVVGEEVAPVYATLISVVETHLLPGTPLSAFATGWERRRLYSLEIIT